MRLRIAVQYWRFTSIGLAATIIVTIWVTKIARGALRNTEDINLEGHASLGR
jgi:hypothetical protein